jgi:peptidoglycan/xylan/chitin deacetylase (PgdA/CDA1 family)
MAASTGSSSKRVRLVVALGLALSGCTAAVPPAPVQARGSGRRPIVALTFDDGPNGRCTEAVLDVLTAARAPATFFLVGAFVDRGVDDGLVARMIEDGHTLGLHGYWHNSIRRTFFTDLTLADLHATTDSIRRALSRQGVLSPPLRFFRPPFGYYTGAMRRAVTLAGLSLVTWGISVNDWPSWRQADDITRPILAQVRPGDVIVLHDGNELGPGPPDTCVDHPALADAVRDLIPALRARGLEPSPLAEVLDDVQASPPAG